MIFDPSGHFASFLVSKDRPNADPSPRVPAGPFVAYYGAYSVDDATKSLTYNIEFGSSPALDKAVRTATSSLSGDIRMLTGSPVKTLRGTSPANCKIHDRHGTFAMRSRALPHGANMCYKHAMEEEPTARRYSSLDEMKADEYRYWQSRPGHDAAWDQRVETVIEPASGLKANFISADDLIAAKLATGRPQDLADVDAIRKAESQVPPPAERKAPETNGPNQ